MSAFTTQAVLFDLDGTLIDSAPDLAGAINLVRNASGLEDLPFERLRPMVGAGARGMVGVAFGLVPGDDGFASLREQFLQAYERHLLVRTRVFDAMQPVLQHLDDTGIPWGIVTNKAALYALPIVQGLGLARRAQAVVCGDTTPHLKPHPEPLLEAARRMGCEPGRCVCMSATICATSPPRRPPACPCWPLPGGISARARRSTPGEPTPS
jgi:N-acetyl-D-muramate 6-phosphate phosphatase